MRVYIVVKETDCFTTYNLNPSDFLYIKCTYPNKEKDPDDAVDDSANDKVITDQEGKIEFKMSENEGVEIDLDATPAQFSIYDSYGTPFCEKETDLHVVEETILEGMADEPCLEDINPDIPPVKFGN